MFATALYVMEFKKLIYFSIDDKWFVMTDRGDM